MTNTLTPSQAARRLQICRDRVIQLHNEARLPATRTQLGRLFEVDVVEQFARDREAARSAKRR